MSVFGSAYTLTCIYERYVKCCFLYFKGLALPKNSKHNVYIFGCTFQFIFCVTYVNCFGGIVFKV